MAHLSYVLLFVLCMCFYRVLPKLRFNGEITTAYAFLIHLAGYETVDTTRGFRFRSRDPKKFSFVKAADVHVAVDKIVNNMRWLLILLGALFLLLAARGLL